MRMMSWKRAYLAALMSPPSRLYYAPPEGDAALRRALQGYLGRARGVHCDAEHIVIVHGSQQAIDLCARVLLDADDTFVFEDPGYLVARRCFEATGARLLSVPVDAHGLDTERLPRDASVRLAYVTPSHQFPLGGTLPIGSRQALLTWARRQRAGVIEDDYDGEFRYGQRPIDALRPSTPRAALSTSAPSPRRCRRRCGWATWHSLRRWWAPSGRPSG
jgi:GntR family transcriptional regulator/MocR family aminotransferase